MTQLRKQKKGARRACCADLEAVLKPCFFKALCDPSRLAILFQGKQVEIGRFLNEMERQELAYELQQAIRPPE
jgi:hypothetical protein